MRNIFRTTVLALAAVGLAACGGGGGDNAFQTPGTGGGGSNVSSVTVSSNNANIPADGSASASITATVKDANNNALNGVTVTFSSPAGSSLVVTQATTDASGQAKADLSASGAAVGSSIIVTATAGTVSGTTSVSVVNTQQTINVVTSSPQIASDGSTSATITAYVRNASNQFMANVPVTFTATSGGLTPIRGTTDNTGTATATLNAAADPTNRTITVTASSGSANGTVPVDVTGTKLTFTGSASLVQGNQSTYTATLTDSGNAAIAGKTVTFSSSNGNTLSTTSATTNASGQASVVVTAANSGTDNLTANALGLTSTQTVSVSNQNFSFTAPTVNANINLGTVQTVTVTWTSSGVAQVGKTVSFSATRGTLSAASAVTDGSGQATVTISSTTSGPSVIAASATGVSAQTTVDFIATTPTSITIQASPSTIPTQGQSTITAVVRDAANNLVEGQTVAFSTVDITGGGLTVASAVTDVQGQAQTIYKASSTASSSNGVTITATVQSNSAVHNSTSLTVGGQAVRLTLGTGIHISENQAKTRFILPYSVTVVDSAGNAVANRQVTLTIHSVQYGKGTWIKSGSLWVQVDGGGGPGGPITCPNEDGNLDGILEAGEDTSGQGNHNNVLDPGDVATVDFGTVTTDATGGADFNVIYAEDHAGWVQVNLTASTTAAGSEASTSAVFWLPMLADYLTGQTPPPGTPSPYGIALSCTDSN